MELRNLKTFLTVARTLNFRSAAESLNCVQSTVSAQIKNLEEELGEPLFHRLGKKVALTTAGRNMVRYAQRIVEMEKEAFSAVSENSEPRGSIALRIPQSLGTYCLPSIIENFREEYPKVGFDINSCEYQLLPRELKAGTTDVAFLLADSVDFSELRTECLSVVELLIVTAPGHRLARRKTVSASDLKDECIIVPKHDCSYRMVFQNILSEEKAKTGPTIETNSIEALKHFAMKGLGIAMVPRISVARELEENKLSAVSLNDYSPEAAVLMIWHRENWLSPMLKAFMDAAREFFRRG
jgi:DNA-binding transcriptional LysR family regulator